MSFAIRYIQRVNNFKITSISQCRKLTIPLYRPLAFRLYSNTKKSISPEDKQKLDDIRKQVFDEKSTKLDNIKKAFDIQPSEGEEYLDKNTLVDAASNFKLIFK